MRGTEACRGRGTLSSIEASSSNAFVVEPEKTDTIMQKLHIQARHYDNLPWEKAPAWHLYTVVRYYSQSSTLIRPLAAPSQVVQI